MNRVHQQQRNAIGRFHRHHRARRVFQQRVAGSQHAEAPCARHAIRRMDLLERSQPLEPPRYIRPARAEAVDQPLYPVQFGHAVNVI